MSADDGRLGPNVYLVGFMGVGKSAIGRRLARAMGFGFLDSDQEIEREEQRTVARIFAEDGEAAFRALERRFIEGGHPTSGTVVACGGGLAVQPGMPELLKRRGVVICLFASPGKIVERTGRSGKRPLLNVDDPEKRVRQLLSAREPTYLQCGTCISTDDRSMSEIVRHVMRSYQKAVRRPTTARKR